MHEVLTAQTQDFQIDNDNKIHLASPSGDRILVNSEVLPVLSQVPDQYQQAYENLCTMYGKDQVDQLRAAGKTVAVLYPFAGMGHVYQARAMAEFYQAMGFRVIFADIFEIAKSDELVRLKMEQSVLESIHHSKPGLWNELVRKDPKYFVMDKLVAAFCDMGYKMYATSIPQGTVIEGKNSITDRISTYVGKNLDQSKHLVPFLFQSLLQLEQRFISNQLQKSLVSFCDNFNVDLIATSHTWAVRPFIGTKYEDRAITAIPDPGYDRADLLFSFIASNSRIAHGTAGGKPAGILSKYFHVPEKYIYDAMGTLAVAPTELSKSVWEADKRWVMVSSSGNNDNSHYMIKALQNWDSRYKDSSGPYGLILFLGMHKGASVYAELERLGLKDNPNIQVIQTSSRSEAAALRWNCKQICQIDVSKPGENPLDEGPLSVVNIGLKAGGYNEERNMHISARLFKSAIPSAWPPEDYEFWKKTPEFSDFVIPGFDGPQENLFDYLDTLYGQNPEGKNYAKEYATRGRYTVPRHAGEYYVALGVGKMLQAPVASSPNIAYEFQSRFARFQKELERSEKLRMVQDLIGKNWKETPAVVDWLEDTLLELAGYKPGQMDTFLKYVAPKTMVVTIHGGAGTRWEESFQTAEGKEVLNSHGINPASKSKARCLVDVPAALSEHFPQKDRQPVVTWSFEAIRDVVCAGAKHLVIAGSEQNKEELLSVASQMGMSSYGRLQNIRSGKSKVQGHGDALLQQLSDLIDAKAQGVEHLVAHFAGDATDSYSIHMSLLLQHVLKSFGQPVSGVLPTVDMSIPKYPVYRDETGRSVILGQKKLYGDESVGNPIGSKVPLVIDERQEILETGGSNIGVWIFNLPTATEILESVAGLYQTSDYSVLPGHEGKQVDEFALEDLVRMMPNIVQILVSSEDEIRSSVKALPDIPGFLSAIEKVKRKQQIRQIERNERVLIRQSV